MSRIVVVDDETNLCAFMCKMLQSKGYEANGFDDAGKALDFILENGADLVLTDVLMPGMDGVELLMNLRKHIPDIKVIAMSGGGTVSAGEYLSMIACLGAVAVLYKPFEAEDLFKIVSENAPIN